jgi:hypothetical protein
LPIFLQISIRSERNPIVSKRRPRRHVLDELERPVEAEQSGRIAGDYPAGRYGLYHHGSSSYESVVPDLDRSEDNRSGTHVYAVSNHWVARVRSPIPSATMPNRHAMGDRAVLADRTTGPDYNTAEVREVQTSSDLRRNRQLDMREEFQAYTERYGKREKQLSAAWEPFEHPSPQPVAKQGPHCRIDRELP